MFVVLVVLCSLRLSMCGTCRSCGCGVHCCIFVCVHVCVCVCCYDNNSSTNSCGVETVAGKMAALYCQPEWMSEWMSEWGSEWSAAVNEKARVTSHMKLDSNFIHWKWLPENERATMRERERESILMDRFNFGISFCRSLLFKCQLQQRMAVALLHGLNRKPG